MNNIGQCPKCGSENLKYGTWDLEGESGYYQFTCDDCGTNGKEWYYLEYEESTIDE